MNWSLAPSAILLLLVLAFDNFAEAQSGPAASGEGTGHGQRRNSPREAEINGVKHQTCATLTKVGRTVRNFGSISECPNHQRSCNGSWEDSSNAILTWQDYRKNNWLDQYKFCTAIFDNKRTCKGAERAATMVINKNRVTDSYLTDLRCKCTDLYQIDYVEVKGELQKFFLKCEKPWCQTAKRRAHEPCAKVSVTNRQTKEAKFNFMCSCPDAFKCPVYLDQVDQDKVYHCQFSV